MPFHRLHKDRIDVTMIMGPASSSGHIICRYNSIVIFIFIIIIHKLTDSWGVNIFLLSVHLLLYETSSAVCDHPVSRWKTTKQLQSYLLGPIFQSSKLKVGRIKLESVPSIKYSYVDILKKVTVTFSLGSRLVGWKALVQLNSHWTVNRWYYFHNVSIKVFLPAEIADALLIIPMFKVPLGMLIYLFLFWPTLDNRLSK